MGAKGKTNSKRQFPGDLMGARHRYRIYEKCALRRGYIWDLSFDDALKLFRSPCVYCGTISSMTLYRDKPTWRFDYNGIDRVDNDLGYTMDNCVPCCKQCNAAKGVLTLREFHEWIDRLVKHTMLTKEKLS